MEKMKNILLVKTLSRYGSVDNYIDKIAAGIRKAGCNTCVLDVWSLASPMHYNHMLSACKFDVVMDVNGMLYKYGAPGNLPKGTLYGTYLCDPPKPLSRQLEMADDRTVVFSCDNDFRSYIDRFYSNVKHVDFIPLSGEAYPEYIPFENRSFDIIFTGTYENPEKIKEKTFEQIQGREELVKLAEDMFEDIITNSHHTLEACLSSVLNRQNRNVSKEEFDGLMGGLMGVHWYARSYFRDKLIRTLLEAGIQIHVFGNGWDTFCCEWKNNLIPHKGGFYAARKALANAKIALNIMPWLKDGFQERIASAMLSKAVAVTDGSKYIQDNFEDGKELVMYSLGDISALAERIRYLLAHPKEAEAIAHRGYEKIQNHTWEERAHDMLRKLEADFSVSLVGRQEGRELEFDMEYPDQRTLLLDAVYELKKLADFVDRDLGIAEKLSGTDVRYLRSRFARFNKQFGGRVNGMEVNPYVWKLMEKPDGDVPKHSFELFSMQLKALMSKLLLNINGFNI